MMRFILVIVLLALVIGGQIILFGPQPARPTAQVSADAVPIPQTEALDHDDGAAIRTVLTRPLFEPGRRPVTSSKRREEAPPVQAAGSLADAFTLLGTMIGTDEAVAVVKDREAGTPLQVRAGDRLGVWQVTAVSDGEVAVSQGRAKAALTFPEEPVAPSAAEIEAPPKRPTRRRNALQSSLPAVEEPVTPARIFGNPNDEDID